MTQRDLAAEAKVTLSYVSRLEAGGAAPGLDLVERLATALGVRIADLLPVEPDEEIEERRSAVKERLNVLVARAGVQTLTMLDLMLQRIEHSPAISR